LFQDGITVGWLLGESFIVDHGRRSVIPERLADALMHRVGDVINPREYYEYVHFSDAVMTDQEILELPKAWVVGGDGGMGDIGYQNTSKVILQNRPNVKAVMLDTQVYSNTGGQNSDSTPMLGGNDMNVFGTATQGKNVEKKTVAHWCATEARFRNHLKKIKPEDAAKLIPLENMLVRITQQDVVYRRYLVPAHRSYVPDFGVYIKVQGTNGAVEYRSLSRQLVLVWVERRKHWRMLQSKA